MSKPHILREVDQFLGCPTSDQWVLDARQDIDVLLLDHANCELKAASTALSLMFRYPQRDRLVYRMSRLAREELRHFEQVRTLILERGVSLRVVTASSYASGLRQSVATSEPQALVDMLIVGAFIEARSCERFARLTPHLDAELGIFYRGLLASEARHFEHYLDLARDYHQGSDETFDLRVAEFRKLESRLITGESSELRFHSGPLSPARRLFDD